MFCEKLKRDKKGKTMKRILTVLIAVLGFAGAASAQNTTGTNSGNNNTAAETEASEPKSEGADCYCCPKGDFCSSKPGTCALHINLNLVKDGEYFCPVIDNVIGSTQGYCPGTGNTMKKMEAKNCIGSRDMKKDKNEGEGASVNEDTKTGK
jgi:hypothetical protein